MKTTSQCKCKRWSPPLTSSSPIMRQISTLKWRNYRQICKLIFQQLVPQLKNFKIKTNLSEIKSNFWNMLNSSSKLSTRSLRKAFWPYSNKRTIMWASARVLWVTCRTRATPACRISQLLTNLKSLKRVRSNWQRRFRNPKKRVSYNKTLTLKRQTLIKGCKCSKWTLQVL